MVENFRNHLNENFPNCWIDMIKCAYSLAKSLPRSQTVKLLYLVYEGCRLEGSKEQYSRKRNETKKVQTKETATHFGNVALNKKNYKRGKNIKTSISFEKKYISTIGL